MVKIDSVSGMRNLVNILWQISSEIFFVTEFSLEIILQIFYNYIVNKIDGIVNKMEDASIGLVDIMAANNIFK